MASGLLTRARRESGLSQEQLAHLAGTSRPTLSAYEHGRKSPTLATVDRLLARTGHELAAVPRIEFVQHPLPRGRIAEVPTALPRLPVGQAFASARLPIHLNWSEPDRVYSLADRAERARVYEVVLREGGPEDVLAYIDGALLIDQWDQLVLPRDVRAAWQPLIDNALTGAAA